MFSEFWIAGRKAEMGKKRCGERKLRAKEDYILLPPPPTPVCFAVRLSECKPVKIQQEESWTVQRYCRRKNGKKKTKKKDKKSARKETKKGGKVGWGK